MYYITSCICIITYHSEDIQSTVMIYGKINVTIYIYTSRYILYYYNIYFIYMNLLVDVMLYVRYLRRLNI